MKEVGGWPSLFQSQRLRLAVLHIKVHSCNVTPEYVDISVNSVSEFHSGLVYFNLT